MLEFMVPTVALEYLCGDKSRVLSVVSRYLEGSLNYLLENSQFYPML